MVFGRAVTPLSVAGCAPVILNAGQTAYFRSRYTQASLAAITAEFGRLSPDDQLGILNDTPAWPTPATNRWPSSST